MQKALLKTYVISAAPAALLFGFWAAFGNDIIIEPPISISLIGPIAFIGAVVFAVALPILLRAKFVKKVEHEMDVPGGAFFAFQKTLQSLALTALYFAAAAYVFQVSRFHFSATFLAALYGAYYYFPSAKRVAYEMKLFRVTGEDE